MKSHRLRRASRNRIRSAAVERYDDLNFHCLWWQTCVKVRLEFKFGSFVIHIFCRVVNTVRWCSNLVTSLLWWKVVSMTAPIAPMIRLTSVCRMNNYDSCSERTAVTWFCCEKMYEIPSTSNEVRCLIQCWQWRDQSRLASICWISEYSPTERGSGTKRRPFCSNTFWNWNVTVASAARQRQWLEKEKYKRPLFKQKYWG